MDLLTPGGTNLIELLLAADQSPLERPGHAGLPDVTEQQLDEALAALADGSIEYVILEDAPEFLQAAGDGDGPYQLEYSPGDIDEQVAATDPIDRAAVAAAMRAFRVRDPAWQTSHTWADAGAGGGRKAGGGGFLKRLFGRG